MNSQHDLGPLQLVATPQEAATILTGLVREMARDDTRLEVLEAGCGKRWPVDLEGLNAHLTGVDTDVEALRVRREQRGDLDEEIVGDLREVPLPEGSFDVIYCSYVLEHVAGAERVLDRFVAALRPGGRLIVRIPDGSSVYGFVTKITPHWVHVAYKRYIVRMPHAGTPGHGPYPTVYDSVISRQGMRDYAASRGLIVVCEYATNHHMDDYGRAAWLVNVGLKAVELLSLRRLSSRHNNLSLVMQTPSSVPSRG